MNVFIFNQDMNYIDAESLTIEQGSCVYDLLQSLLTNNKCGLQCDK